MSDDLTSLRAEISALRQENERLKTELEELRQEYEDLLFESDLDACQIAGLTNQARALIAEGDACPHRHPLLERGEYVNSRTGEKMTKTRSYPLYREGFDAEAGERGIANPERYRG